MILTGPKPLNDLDGQGQIFQFCFNNCHNFFINLIIDFTHTWTKQHI